jgi:hypothetical protein
MRMQDLSACPKSSGLDYSSPPGTAESAMKRSGVQCSDDEAAT